MIWRLVRLRYWTGETIWMCNHYRTDPALIPTWSQYARFDIRQPNVEFACDVYPRRPGMIVRQDDGAIRSDVML